MTLPDIQSGRPKRSLLALVLAVVLALAVLLAWSVGQGPRARVQAGEAMLADLHQYGLARDWGDALQVEWFMVYHGREADPRGWKVTVRGPAGEGSYAGLSLWTQGGGKYTFEQWSLNADATRGVYAAARGRRGPISVQRVDTRIALDDGVVKILRGTARSAQEPAPDHYLPKGTVEWALRRVADEGADAQFMMILNEHAIVDRTVRFMPVRFRYLGEEKSPQGAPARRVAHSALYSEGAPREYLIGSDGKILSVSDSGVRTKAAAEEQVRRTFGEARGFVRSHLPESLQRAWDTQWPAPPG